jgi:hypothetical protein
VADKPTNNQKFLVKNGLAVGASGFEVINTAGEWVGNSGPGESPYGATGVVGTDGATGATGVAGIDGASGATGIDGYQGTTGVEGYQGATGAQGYQGASGADGYQGITGATGARGATGEIGTTGDQGTDGATGATGVAGIDGASGAAGIDGASGVTGETGATGVHGHRYHTTSTTTLNLTTGATGVVVVDDYLNYSYGQTILLADGGGKHIHATVTSWDANTKILAFTPIDHVGTGSASSWEINLDGAEGQVGASGVTGQDGATGATGAQGYQGATGIQGATGADGEQGYQGASGADGVQGATGAAGIDGASGAQGIDGASGADGVQGATGSQGSQGDEGDQGYQGIDGATGYTGATGAQGGDGSSSAVQFDTSYGHYGAHQTISSGSNGTNTILSGTVGYIESAIGTAEMATYANSGLSMFGVRLDADIPATTNRIGLGTSGIDVNNALGMYDNQSQGFQQDGAVYTNGAQTDALGISWGVGDLVEVAVNYNTGYFWARVNGGAWSKGGDPATNTNGSPFLLAQPHSYPAVSTLDGAVFELITTPQYDVPSGYTYLGNGAPTNTGIQGASGADGVQGPDGNAGYDADQLTTGNPRGLWDVGTTYYPGDIVVTMPADSHRCLVENTGLYPDSYPEYWAWTAWAGASGASGINGSTGPVGVDGASGAQGIDGASGASGIDGASGAAGIDGASGAQGETGYIGAAGIDGASGAAGIDGASGITGATGYSGLQFKATADGNFSVYAIGTPITIPFLADPDTGATTYNYSTGQSVIIAKDINNYMVADITNVIGGGSGIDVEVTASYGNATGVSGWIVNLDGAVGWIGASGATGIFGASGISGTRGYTGGNGAAYNSINVTVSSFGGYTGLDNAWLEYPTLMGSFLRVNGPISGIAPGMTVTYGGHTYTVYNYIENNNEYSMLNFTDYPVTLGAIPPGASIVIEGFGPAENDGYQGASGADGYQGASGAAGIDGASGVDGDQGATGYQGATGTQGASGSTGTVGLDGATGFLGVKGYGFITGTTGLSGTSQQTVDRFQSNDQGTVKYIVQGVEGTNVQATEVILTQNADGVYMTEYATLRTGATGHNVMSVTATTDGSVVSLKVTPTVSGTDITWQREGVKSRIGGTTIYDPSGTYLFSSRDHADVNSIPNGQAYIYPSDYWYDTIDFATLAANNTNITFDSAGIGPQNPANGYVVAWDGAVLTVVTINGNFTSRDDLNKITYGY